MSTDLIRDPLLRSVLDAANRTRDQCILMLDFLDENAIRDPSTPEAPEPAQQALARQQKQLTARLALFRGQYRSATLGARETKAATAEAKSEVDTLHLQLQNLLYEQRHLKGEIAACDNYSHSYQSLDLYPEDELLSSNPELKSLSAHDLMLARISDEHKRRQTLEDERQMLLERRQELVSINKGKKEELEALDREVEKFIGSAAAVREVFDTRDAALNAEKEAAAASAVVESDGRRDDTTGPDSRMEEAPAGTT